jgi:eukaryotic-like serine/threonine-protein kinase
LLEGRSSSNSQLSMPERVGDYELLVPLGSGGMATVYLARKPVVQDVTRDFALKLMHAHLRGDPDWATHLLDEARIVARIRHPNVVQLVEAGDDPSGVFLVLEYVEGDTLSGLSRALRAKHKQLPLAISGRIVLDALAGLHASHEVLGLVHRDFSPQNILVGADGIAKLTDFGIAKASDGKLTASGVVKGKFSYMSPEQARGRTLDRRSDVWAAGVIVWELLARRRLFPNRNDADTLLAVVSERPPLLSDVVAGIPKELSAAVASALEPEVERRCPDAQTLRDRLLEPWSRHAAGLADASELGAFVQAAVAEALALRRADVERVLSRRRSATGSANLMEVSGVATPNAAERSDDSLVVSDPTLLPAEATPRTGRAIAMGAGSAFLLVAIAAVILFSRSADPPQALAADQSPAPEISAPEPDPRGAARVSSLVVRANAEIQRLRIGRRTIEIEKPARSVEVVLSAEESSRALRVEATSTSGATAWTEVAEHEAMVSVQFATPRATRFSGPRPKPKAKSGDELAPTPFK